jgi:hypothetical protein
MQLHARCRPVDHRVLQDVSQDRVECTCVGEYHAIAGDGDRQCRPILPLAFDSLCDVEAFFEQLTVRLRDEERVLELNLEPNRIL